jgi:hypothetical protein
VDRFISGRDHVELYQVSSTEGISLSRMLRFHLYRGASALLLELTTVWEKLRTEDEEGVSINLDSYRTHHDGTSESYNAQ